MLVTMFTRMSSLQGLYALPRKFFLLIIPFCYATPHHNIIISIKLSLRSSALMLDLYVCLLVWMAANNNGNAISKEYNRASESLPCENDDTW